MFLKAISITGPRLDFVIKNGNVWLEKNKHPEQLDIGVSDNKIVLIKKDIDNAYNVIDAKGLDVVPGFIDVHTHCDATFSKLGLLRYPISLLKPSLYGNHNYLFQGVTTVVTGNCGEGYTSTSKWLDLVSKIKFGTNVAHLVPHGAIRSELFGPSVQNITLEQRKILNKRIEAELNAGAFGVSTGLEYAPGVFADYDEILGVAKIAAKYNSIYASHMQNEAGQPISGFGIMDSIKFISRLGENTKGKIHISHLKLAKPYGDVTTDKIIDSIELNKKNGIDITADQYPFDAASSSLSYLLPMKFKKHESIRDEFKSEPGFSELEVAVKDMITWFNPEHILISYFKENKNYEGKTIAAIAELENITPVKMMMEILVSANKLPMCVFFNQLKNNVEELMKPSWVYTGSDGWTVPFGMTTPHPRLYETFLKKLGFVNNSYSFSQALASMTYLPAERFGIKQRGLIKEGYFADIVLLDRRLKRNPISYTKPHQFQPVVRHSFVNGVHVIADNVVTGKRSGNSLVR